MTAKLRSCDMIFVVVEQIKITNTLHKTIIIYITKSGIMEV